MSGCNVVLEDRMAVPNLVPTVVPGRAVVSHTPSESSPAPSSSSSASSGPTGPPGDEGRPTLRLCRIPSSSTTSPTTTTPSCGFHISRTQWDPYPWVSAVEVGSPAEQAGLCAGDCVLEVNGEDVLGQRIGEVAAKVRAGRAKDRLQLLVWNAGCDPGTAVTLTAGSGPTPLNLQLLSSCLQQASQLLECPVCLEGVSPPVWQCCHGHLLCSGCRARSDRCPLCRVPLGPRGRSLLADKLHDLLTQTYRRYNDQRLGQMGNVPAEPTTMTPAISVTGSATPDEDDAERQPRADDAVPSRAVTTTADTNEHRAQVSMRGVRLAASTEDVSVDARLAVPNGPRARSQSAGHIATQQVMTKDEAGLVHCPYGSACSSTLPAADVFNHLREDHDGPLMQYFPREGRDLWLPHPSEANSALPSLTMLTMKAGNTMFLHAERGCMWLWSLASAAPAPAPATAPATTPATTATIDSIRLCVDFPDDSTGKRILAPVFPLTASSDDAIASGRCVRVPDTTMRISVKVSAETPAT